MLEIKNISKSFNIGTPEQVTIFDNFSLKIEEGVATTIIGPNGCGKSTLMNLLCRFYDVSEGQIKVDGINVKEMDLYSLRKNIGMAMQEVFLFSSLCI